MLDFTTRKKESAAEALGGKWLKNVFCLEKCKVKTKYAILSREKTTTLQILNLWLLIIKNSWYVVV